MEELFGNTARPSKLLLVHMQVKIGDRCFSGHSEGLDHLHGFCPQLARVGLRAPVEQHLRDPQRVCARLLPGGQEPVPRPLGTGGSCSPPHTMQFNSRYEGFECVYGLMDSARYSKNACLTLGSRLKSDL
jgi:hypothetical protein